MLLFLKNPLSILLLLLRLSDGSSCIRGIITISPEISEIRLFDVVDVSRFQLARIKKIQVLIILQLRHTHNNVKTLIGKPVECDSLSHRDEAAVNIRIPACARYLANQTRSIRTVVKSFNSVG